MHTHRLLQLAQDIRELASLDTGGSGACVAVHRIALPDHGFGVLGTFYGADVGGEERTDFGCAVSCDECDFADFDRGVEGTEEGEEVGGAGCGTDFYSEGIGDAAEVLDVCAVYLAGAVAYPEEMSGGVVVGFAFFCMGVFG